ncbi:MAG: M55 family metallopeptidase [Chloroflexi bacterium]|nr:M55 family metallopeptidase [Chloroflexota bacterium]
MKVYISYDFEGGSGVHHSDHMDHNRFEYPMARELLMGDLNATIAGAFDGGATEVLVNENHYTMKNILAGMIDPRARYISGWNKRNLSMAGLDSSFDLAFLVGYHAMAGTADGVLSHTLLGRQIHNVRINGAPVGETAMAAALAGCYGVPISLVTGDAAVAREAEALLGNPKTVAVKEGIDRFTAIFLAPSEAQTRIRQAAKEAVQSRDSFKVYRVSSPVRLEVEFTGVSMATSASLIPGFKREGSRTVSFKHEDFETVYNGLVVAAMLALSPFTCDELY